MEESIYKASKYNIIIEDQGQALIIANTLTCIIEKYPISYSKQIESILSNDIYDCNDELIDSFKDNGFLVSKEIDETQMAVHNYNKKMYSEQRLILTIVPTEDCNMRCVYCYEEHRHNYMSDTDVDILIRFLKKKMRTSTSLLIRWFGGEPLLCLDTVIKVMNKVKKYGELYRIPVEGQMTTNGVLLNSDAFERLYNCGVRYFQITLDGKKEVHNRYRPMVNGLDSFSLIANNFNYILRQRKRVNITIRVNLVKDSINNAFEYLDYLIDNYLYDSRFSLMIMNVRNLGGTRINNLELLKYNELDSVMNYVIRKGIIPVGSAGLDGYEMCCEASTINSYYINWDLAVYKCGNTIYNGDDIGRLGRIDCKGEIRLDENKLAIWMKQKNMYEKCPECKFFPLCMSHFCPYSINIWNSSDCSAHKSFIMNKILAYSKNISIKNIRSANKNQV